MTTARWIWVFAGVSLGLLVAALLLAWLLGGFEALGLGFHGMLAFLLGAVLSALLAIGLMALVFYSNRSRTDEEVHHGDRSDR